MRVVISLLWSLSATFILASSEVQDGKAGLVVNSIVDDLETQSHRNLQTRKCHKKAFLNASGNCECMPGFEGNDPRKQCTDINECSSTIQACIDFTNTFCVNTLGGFKCLCTIDYHYGNPARTGIACRKKPPKKVNIIEIDPKPKEIGNHVPDLSKLQTISPTKMKCSGSGSGVNLCGDYIHSYCLDLPNGGGYTCKCDEGKFVVYLCFPQITATKYLKREQRKMNDINLPLTFFVNRPYPLLLLYSIKDTWGIR